MASITTIILLMLIGNLDWQQRRIPNKLVLILAGWAVFNAAFYSDIYIQYIMINIGIGLALTLPGYLKGIVGGGDVKLMLAIAPLWPPSQLLWVFSIGVFGLLLLMLFINLLSETLLTNTLSDNRVNLTSCSLKRGVPLGSAIAMGALYMSIYTYILS